LKSRHSEFFTGDYMSASDLSAIVLQIALAPGPSIHDRAIQSNRTERARGSGSPSQAG